MSGHNSSIKGNPVPPALKAGGINISTPFFPAPMDGVTIPAFRRLLKKLNKNAIGLTFTEFVNVNGITKSRLYRSKLTSRFLGENPLSVQIYGSDPDAMASGASIVEKEGADMIDLNFGCPARKVVNNGSGSDLMRDLKRLAEIVKSVKSAVSIPVTAKCRTGWDKSSINVYKVAEIAELNGLSWLTIHGRTREMAYKGEADWDIISEVKKNSGIPVIGNGDIDTPQKIIEAFQKYNVDGVMVGRAILRDPLIFTKAQTGKDIRLSAAEETAIFKDFADYMDEDGYTESGKLGKLKGFLAQYSKGRQNSARFRNLILRSQTIEDFFKNLSSFFSAT
ncbi:MAG: tRNA dihydrouridine synthase [Fibrobacterota bacterium]